MRSCLVRRTYETVSLYICPACVLSRSQNVHVRLILECVTESADRVKVRSFPQHAAYLLSGASRSLSTKLLWCRKPLAAAMKNRKQHIHDISNPKKKTNSTIRTTTRSIQQALFLI